MRIRQRLLILCLCIGPLVTGCRPSKPAPTESPVPSTAIAAPAADSTAARPVVVLAPAEKPGILSGIGKIFSTPAGVARRQAVRLAKASAPKIGKKAQGTIITGNGNNDVKQAQTAKGAASAVNADSGAVVTTTQIGKNKASAATAPGATATTTKPAFSWWWLLLVPAGYVVYRGVRLVVVG